MKAEFALAATAALCIAGGCIQVKTESEIKPIHITMDVNLKVDKDLDKAFADENQQKPKGDFKAVKEMVDRQAAGITNRAMLEERNGATDDDRILIAEENAKRMKRFRDVAKETARRSRPSRSATPRRCARKSPPGPGIRTTPESGSKRSSRRELRGQTSVT